MGYRDTGGGPVYVATTDITIEVLRYQAQEELRDSGLRKLDARVAWEHVLNVLAILDRKAARVAELEQVMLRAIELNERVPQDKLSTPVVAQRNQLRAALGLIVPVQRGEEEPDGR